MKTETYLEYVQRLHDDDGDDLVNKPKHYNQSGIECIDAIEAATGDGFEFYLQGNILKYLWRYRYKNQSQDLEKAAWYLEKLIETVNTIGKRNDTTRP